MGCKLQTCASGGGIMGGVESEEFSIRVDLSDLQPKSYLFKRLDDRKTYSRMIQLLMQS